MILSASGLALNFIGSFLIAISIRLKHSLKVVKEAKEYDIPTAKKICNEIGIWILSIGFLMQILGLALN